MNKCNRNIYELSKKELDELQIMIKEAKENSNYEKYHKSDLELMKEVIANNKSELELIWELRDLKEKYSELEKKYLYQKELLKKKQNKRGRRR